VQGTALTRRDDWYAGGVHAKAGKDNRMGSDTQGGREAALKGGVGAAWGLADGGHMCWWR